MDISKYVALTGKSISTSQLALYSATIRRTQRMLEHMLGYSLSPELRLNNQYVEAGKATNECPCTTLDYDNLGDPDTVQKAYRLFPYHKEHRYLIIDPATTIYAVKLVLADVTYRSFTLSDYRPYLKNGYITSLQQLECLCSCVTDCNRMQLAIDADWCFTDIPDDLLYVWCDMTEYYADPKRDIKSQTLGPHSYTKFNNNKPEELSGNINVLKKYAGPNGSLYRIIV